LELFDILKVIFEKPDEWKNVSSNDKSKNFFILNRRFAINYPLQANILQYLKINPIDVIDFWQHFLRKSYNKTPFWIYTKGVKKTQEIKEKKTNLSKDLIDQYCKVYNIDKKTIRDALEFYPNEITQEIKQFEKMIKN
jgi:hypothetical protein